MDAWSRSLERLEAEFPPEDVHTWLKPLQADLRADSLVLYAPNAFIVDQVRELYPVSYTHLDVYKRQALSLDPPDPPLQILAIRLEAIYFSNG